MKLGFCYAALAAVIQAQNSDITIEINVSGDLGEYAETLQDRIQQLSCYAFSTTENLQSCLDGEVTTTPNIIVTTTPAPIVTTEGPTEPATQPPVVETTQPPSVETTQPPVVETTQPPVVETTQPPVIETTQAPPAETTQPPVVETTQAPLAETTQPPVATTQPAPVETTQSVVETTQPPLQTTAGRSVDITTESPEVTTQPQEPNTTEPPVVETTQSPPVETTQPPVVETTQAPLAETTQPPVAETTQPPVVETTQPPVIETTQAPPAETTQPPVVETTQGPVVDTTQAPPAETTQPPIITTQASPETTQPPTEAPTTQPATTAQEWGDCTCDSTDKDNLSAERCDQHGVCEACTDTTVCGTLEDWTTWDTCTVTCGTGTQTRQQCFTWTDTANNPDCETETQDCNTQDCPAWAAWKPWGSCGAACTVSGEAAPERSRYRCWDDGVNGEKCAGGQATSGVGDQCGRSAADVCYQIQEESCNEDVICTVTCAWSDWGEWGGCTPECEDGLRIRRRTNNEDDGASCDGNGAESERCSTVQAGNVCPDCLNYYEKCDAIPTSFCSDIRYSSQLERLCNKHCGYCTKRRKRSIFDRFPRKADFDTLEFLANAHGMDL